MSTRSTVVILGCGVGGLVVANLLAKQAKGAPSIKVVERKRSFQFPPSYPWLMMGWRQPLQVQRDLKALARKKIQIINEEVVSIDLSGRKVRTESSEVSYDHLVVSLGAEYALEEVSGFGQYAHHIYDLESTVKFRDALQNFNGGTLLVGISRLPFKCPAAPYEAALLLEDYFRKTKKKVDLQFFTPEAQPVPAAGPVIGKQVEKLLGARGIRFHPKISLFKVEANRVIFDNRAEIPYDLLLAVPPHRCPKPVVDAGLTDSSGWVPVNPQTLATKFENVYALGDVASIQTPHGHVPFLPKAGVFAHGQAEVVANNIAVSITGKGERKTWDGTGSCFLEVSKGQGAFLKGNFLSNPPRLEFHPPRRKWHLEKVLFEKYWMRHWF